ncbi:hypothetical protein [Schaalia sp. Marseille-Q2122]|uniref:hypothetical protein n=1 Tax=Schaalia sp. Marseille-Q2122 TaxID=2736604 RepID=UPI001C37AA20|nr:hypothetical protein [Schaalia sp. Marseille-Q2122]
MMLTKKSRMTSLVAIAATVMLVFSTNAANAAHQSGHRTCRVNQVGEISAFVYGTGHLEAPGDNWRSRRYFDASRKARYEYKNAWSQGGGHWLAYASRHVSAVTTGCINGNF